MSVTVNLDEQLTNADWVKKSNDRLLLFVQSDGKSDQPAPEPKKRSRKKRGSDGGEV